MNQAGASFEKRLYGWKAIAAYFRRDRSTVMRWAHERKLPVHRLPGGKHGSVFAIEHELAEWSLHSDDLDLIEADVPDAILPRPILPGAALPDSGAMPKSRRRRTIAVILGAAALLALLVLAWPRWSALTQSSSARVAELPADPAVAADYIAARDAWARRTPAEIKQAIKLYQGVIRRDQGFAPAHTGLADAWLILREYGEVHDAPAFHAARSAAEQGLRLDPRSPGAHRAIGFVHYWWANDAPAAIAAFERAVALDGRDPHTHFWFANMLADMGDHDRARREYDRARLLSPGSRPIQIEYAFSRWHAGEDAEALRLLTALAERHPTDATIRDCLAWIHIGNGDIAGFAREYEMMARNRGQPDMLRLSAALGAAIARDPATAHRLLIADARREIAEGTRRLRKTPAYYASSMGDRAQLVALMTEARNLGEIWYTAGIASRIARRWRGDAQIESLLASLHPPEIDPNP